MVAAGAAIVDVRLGVDAGVVTAALPRSLIASATTTATTFRSLGAAGGHYASCFRIGDGVVDDAELARVVPVTLAADEFAIGNFIRFT